MERAAAGPKPHWHPHRVVQAANQNASFIEMTSISSRTSTNCTDAHHDGTCYHFNPSSQPLILIEEEQSSCVCGVEVIVAWEVTHAQGDAEVCAEHACSDCWYRWMWAQVDDIRDPDLVRCICNQSTVTFATVQCILTNDDFTS